MEPLQEFSYQQHILRKISINETSPDFPKYKDFGIDKRSFEDYLSDKQDILDIPGSQTRQLKVYGSMVVIPALISSAFDHTDMFFGSRSTLVGIGFGILLALACWGITSWRVKTKMKNLYDSKMESYLSAVDNY